MASPAQTSKVLPNIKTETKSFVNALYRAQCVESHKKRLNRKYNWLSTRAQLDGLFQTVELEGMIFIITVRPYPFTITEKLFAFRLIV